jgi:acetyl-CoA synthetase
MSGRDLGRLIAPKSIALIGAGAWTDAVAAGNRAIGYRGEIWRVHPTRPSTATTTYYRSVAELPGAPDSAFLAVPGAEVPAVAGDLRRKGAGGFVCFSSGFSEVGAAGDQLTQQLLKEAGEVPFFGPNCYGYVNFFDRVAMMPDQIVGSPPERGIALICQSGTLALTLMYHRRSLPLGLVFSVGNQTRLSVEDLIQVLCHDERVTAFGLYLEGIKDPVRFAKAADAARRAGKPIALIKSGRTALAARTAHSHTGAMTGADQVFDTFCHQAGIARCDTLGTLCETLKIFHSGGPLRGRKVIAMGCSGGDMAMTADVSRHLSLDFQAVPESSTGPLKRLLGERVTIANPFDLHTYLWFDAPALKRVFDEVFASGFDAAAFMLDPPPEGEADTSSFDVVIDAYIEAAQSKDTRVALLSSLPETMGASVRARCFKGGVVPLQGQREGLEALSMAAAVGERWRVGAETQLHLGLVAGDATAMSESDAKAALGSYGVRVPRGAPATPENAALIAATLGFPVALKVCGEGIEHKTELGGVALFLKSEDEVKAAALRLGRISPTLLVEEMVSDGIAEVLIGVTVDAQFGQVLVLGSGGIFAEALADSVSLLPPWTKESIAAALSRLSVAKLFAGHRGKPPADLNALIETAMGVARYATEHQSVLAELDVNPVIVRPQGRGAVAVDAMIRLKKD